MKCYSVIILKQRITIFPNIASLMVSDHLLHTSQHLGDGSKQYIPFSEYKYKS